MVERSNFLRQLRLCLSKETSLLLRQRSELIATFLIGVVLVLLGVQSVDPISGEGGLQRVVILRLLISLVFFQNVIMLRLFFSEENRGDAFSGLVLYGARADSVFIAKSLVAVAFALVSSSVLFILGFVFAGLSFSPSYLLPLALMTSAFTVLGTLLNSLVCVHPKSDLIVPVLLLPSACILVFSAAAASEVIMREGIGSFEPNLVMLAMASVVFVSVGMLIFDVVGSDLAR